MDECYHAHDYVERKKELFEVPLSKTLCSCEAPFFQVLGGHSLELKRQAFCRNILLLTTVHWNLCMQCSYFKQGSFGLWHYIPHGCGTLDSVQKLQLRFQWTCSWYIYLQPL